MLREGSRGVDVRMLQQQLRALGYEVEIDGWFGPITNWGVLNLQAMFGYTIDGIVGPATDRLIQTQSEFGWNVNRDDAQRWALKAQGLFRRREEQARKTWG